MKNIKRNLGRGIIFLFSVIVFLIVCIVWAPTAFLSTPTDFSNMEEIQSFDAEVEALREELEIPGISLAVIENEKVVHSNFYGYKNAETLDPITENTLFEICSLSKMYEIYATMLLSQNGSIDIHKPLYETLVHDGISYDKRHELITPRMVLNHTSGIENWIEFYDPDKLEIVADPGTSYEYSGEGYNYLAKVTEILIDAPYEEYLDSLVLKPLNIKDKTAYFVNTDRNDVTYTTGHTISGQISSSASTALSPASSICTTAEAYAEMLLSLFSTDQLTQESIDYILKEEVPLLEFGEYGAYISNGFIVNVFPDNVLIVFFGSNSGYKSQILYSLTEKRGFIYLTNSDGADLLARRLNDLTFEFPFYNQAVYNDYSGLELFSVYRNASSIKNERPLFDKIFDRSSKLSWSDLWQNKNFLFLLIEIIFFGALLGLIVMSFLKIFIRKRFRQKLNYMLDKCMLYVRYLGATYFICWVLFALFSTATMYNPLLFFLFLILLFSQLFWLKWIRDLNIARLTLSILMILLLLVPSGVFMPYLEIKEISYIRNDFHWDFISIHVIGGLVCFVLLVGFLIKFSPVPLPTTPTVK